MKYVALAALFAALVLPGPVTAQQRISGDFWYVAGMIYTFGSGGEVGRTGASLGWKCSGRTLQVVYGWDKYLLGSNGNVRVTFSVDQGEARAQNWRMQPNNRSALMPQHLVAGFTRAAKAGRTALFGVRDLADGETLVDAFSLMGVTRSLQRLPCAR